MGSYVLLSLSTHYFLKYCTDAISLKEDVFDYFLVRCKTFIRLEHLTEARLDVSRMIELKSFEVTKKLVVEKMMSVNSNKDPAEKEVYKIMLELVREYQTRYT